MTSRRAPALLLPQSNQRTWSGTTLGAVHYYALDLPGNNVNGLFNGSGSVTHRYHYTPWGQAQSTSEATYNPLRYASRELDAATGLYYNRARWYDPYLGRFISEDPIGIDGGINVYAYAGNDPVNFTDPMGLTCVGQIYTSQTTCKLAPIRIRPPGWLRRAWDALHGNRRWGGLPEGRGPTSIMGDGVVAGQRNADDDMDLIDESVTAAAEASEEPTTFKGCVVNANTSAVTLGSAAIGGAVKAAKPFLDNVAEIADDVAKISRERFLRSGRWGHFRAANGAARVSVLARTGAGLSATAGKYVFAGAVTFEVTVGLICLADASYYD